MKKLLALALFSTLPAAALAQTAPAPLKPDEAAFRAHVALLADDDMRGREAGTPDYDRAAAYVADQLAKAGVKPAGSAGGFLQSVPLSTAKAAGQGSLALVGADGREVPLAFGTEYLPGVSGRQAVVSIDAPVVFVGYGVSAPDQGHDDYAGLDVRGKVVAIFSGAPKSMQGEVRAHYGNATTKAVEAEKRGAVAVLQLYSPTQAQRVPFSRGVDTWQSTRMTWRTPEGTGFSPAKLPSAGSLSEAGTDKLFASDPAALARLRAADLSGAKLGSVALPVRVRAKFSNTLGTAESSNVVGLIEGSDPTLKNEYVVLSAHLDHVGVGTAVNGDTIYNGAMDNATGIATLIEVAKRFQKAGQAPKRSILLVAVTAEEKGLVGSDYFARNPVRPIGSIVADVNLDMPILTYRFTDVIAFGADRSSLGPIVKAAVEPMGLAMTPDPEPEEGIFTRSDHYRFVQQGVPSVFLKPGPANGGAEANKVFRGNDYHRPSDEIDLPFDWTSGAKFVEANYAIARAIADAPQRPLWNKGDFFGTQFKGPMAP
jgi:hypothetical protein